MSESHKHQWRPHPDNPKKVICTDCGKDQYRSKLTAKQLEELKRYEKPVLDIQSLDQLMYVGKSFYSIEKFIAEARRMGVCKRVPPLPWSIKPGETRIFLAHEEALKEPLPEDQFMYHPGVFAWFLVRGIAYIVGPDVSMPELFKEKGITEYEYVPGGFGFADERGCGSLVVGGTYLLSEEDLEKCRDLAESSMMEGQIEVIDPPVPLELKRFRGTKSVIGDYILSRRPEEEWYAEASEIYMDNLRAIKSFKRRLKRWKEKQEAET